jgi:hypothetical protein
MFSSFESKYCSPEVVPYLYPQCAQYQQGAISVEVSLLISRLMCISFTEFRSVKFIWCYVQKCCKNAECKFHVHKFEILMFCCSSVSLCGSGPIKVRISRDLTVIARIVRWCDVTRLMSDSCGMDGYV